MNRARSPLFILTVLLIALAGAGVGLVLESTSGPAPWKAGGVAEGVSRLGNVLVSVALGPLMLILLAELAIRFGWEPRWLRVRYIGVTILDKEMDADRPGHGWLTVALPDKRMERYSADADEYNSVEETNVVVLEVIGQYVADVRRMRGTSAEEAEAIAALPGNRVGVRRHASILRPRYAGLNAWLAMILAPGLAGWMLSNGVLAIVMKSVDFESGRRYGSSVHVLYGDQATWYGFALVAVGLVILGVSAYRWKAGWDAEDFDSGGNYWDDREPYGCRRSWWH